MQQQIRIKCPLLTSILFFFFPFFLILFSQRHSGASGTLHLSKGKKARPSNLPPFLPSRTLSSIEDEGGDRMDSEGNSPAAHLAEGMESKRKEGGKGGRREGSNDGRKDGRKD